MYHLKIKNHRDDILDFDRCRDYTVYKIDGLTPPAVNISQTDHTTMDGGVINSVRMGKRNIVIYMVLGGVIERSRISLYRYFPPKRTITVYFANGMRDVYIDGVVETVECDPFSSPESAQISIICPDPHFRGMEKMVSGFSETSDGFEFPFSIPKEGTEFGSIKTCERKVIVNTGDDDTGLVIRLYAHGGSVENPVIYNVLEKNFIKLNMTMQQSDLVTINSNAGKKSIMLTRSGVSVNAMGYLAPDSTWPVLAAGDNAFAFDAQGKEFLQVTFENEILYSGV